MAMVQIGGCRCCSDECKAIQKEIDEAKENGVSEEVLKELYAKFRAYAHPRYVAYGSKEYLEYEERRHKAMAKYLKPTDPIY